MEENAPQQAAKLFVTANAGVLGRSIIALDGNLLIASWKGGCYIPDRMVEREEFLSELREEVCRIIRGSTKLEDYRTFFQLLHRRRSDTQLSVEVLARTKIHRKSWGPDDTWSGLFANEAKLSKKNSSSDRRSYHFTEAEQLKDRQPIGGYRCRGNNKKRLEPCPYHEPSKSCTCSALDIQRRRELMKMVAWTCEEGCDYVNTEMVRSVIEAEMLLDVMLASKTPVVLAFRVNSPSEISVTYQFLHNFKQEYMVLKISKTHCMLMRAF